jgi:hypothetical protein
MDHENTRVRRETQGTTYAPEPRVTEKTEDAGTDARTREIRAEIEQTRGDMSETVDAIQERLRPGTIAANAAETVKHAAADKVRDIADSDSVRYVQANPVAVTMVGIGGAGLAWLMFAGNDARSSSRRQRRLQSSGSYYRPESYQQYGEITPSAELAQSTGRAEYGSSAGRAEYGTYDENPSWRTQAPNTPRRAYASNPRRRSYGQNPARRTWNRNPLLVGAASAVIGALVGLAVPETEREHQLMGETRDGMLESVQEAVQTKVSDVQKAVTDAVGNVQDAAKRAVGTETTDTTSGDRQTPSRS